MILLITFWILSLIINSIVCFQVFTQYYKQLMVKKSDQTMAETLFYLFIKDSLRTPTPVELANKINELDDFIAHYHACPPHEWIKNPDGTLKCSKCQKNTVENLND